MSNNENLFYGKIWRGILRVPHYIITSRLALFRQWCNFVLMFLLVSYCFRVQFLFYNCTIGHHTHGGASRAGRVCFPWRRPRP